MRAKLTKNAEHVIYLPVPELSTKHVPKDSCCPNTLVFLDPYWDKVSFMINAIKEHETFNEPRYFKVINGSIFEIGQYCWDRSTWYHLTSLVPTFAGETKVLPQAIKISLMPYQTKEQSSSKRKIS